MGVTTDGVYALRIRLRTAGGALAAFLFPALLCGQMLGRQALSSFPADTPQLAYANLAELRSSPDYPQIRARLLNTPLRYFQDYLRATGINPDKDVDEVALGWPAGGDSSAYFGLAQGRFQPDSIHDYFIQNKLPSRQYNGFDLYAFGTGQASTDVYFAFFDSSLAAFGRLPVLKAILDLHQNSGNALQANTAFANWEGELEDTAPQWGILTGKAAANLAAPWITGGKNPGIDLSVALAPVQAVLYRVRWGGGFTSQLSIVCRDSQAATALAGLITLWQQAQSQQPAASGVASLVQNLEAHAEGARVELTASGPAEALDQILRGGP